MELLCAKLDFREKLCSGEENGKVCKNHRMSCSGRDPKDHEVPTPFHKQAHQPPDLVLDQVAQGPIHPSLEHLQEQSIQILSGQPVLVLALVVHLCCNWFLKYFYFLFCFVQFFRRFEFIFMGLNSHLCIQRGQVTLAPNDKRVNLCKGKLCSIKTSNSS